MVMPEFEKVSSVGKKKKKKLRHLVNPHHRLQPMDEVQIDLGEDLERRMDTRTNAHLMGIDGSVGRGIDSGSDLNTLTPGDTDENEYEPITDENLLTTNAYIRGVFQESSVLKEDDTTALQHQHKKRTFSNRLETDQIEQIPAHRKEEPSFTPPSRKKEQPQQPQKLDD